MLDDLFRPLDQLDAAVSHHERRQDGNSRCPRTVEHGLGIVCCPAGPISLSAVFSSLVSPMGTTDVTGRRIGDMRSDGVHGSLKTTGMTTVPQFQLQRTSRGWVRRSNSPFRIPLVGLCSSLPYACCVDLGYILYTPQWILKEV